MNILSAVILGIIQGLTEFLPVSSSAHLALCHDFFGVIDPAEFPAFDVFLHLGTLFAVMLHYRKDAGGLIKGYFTLPYSLVKQRFKVSLLPDKERLALFTAAATVPTVVFTLLGMGDLSDKISAYPLAIAFLLIVNGFMLLTANKKCGNITLSEMKAKHVLSVGLFEALATVPGISRSGATITGGVLSGLDREFAVKFSFLMSIPAIIGACVLKLPEVLSSNLDIQEITIYLIGAVSALLSGFAAIKLIEFISKKSNFNCFSVYCIAVGVIINVYYIFR